MVPVTCGNFDPLFHSTWPQVWNSVDPSWPIDVLSGDVCYRLSGRASLCHGDKRLQGQIDSDRLERIGLDRKVDIVHLLFLSLSPVKS